jgi:hypothetical protein
LSSRARSTFKILPLSGRIAFLAVGELPGQAEGIQHPFAPGEIARLARGLARARRLDDLAADDARVVRPLEEELAELLGDDLLDHRAHFRGHELVLGLRGELGLRHLDRENRGEPFLHVVAGGLHLRLLGELARFYVLVERARHRRAQPRHVGAAVALRDVVGEALHRFLVGIVPLHRDLDDDAVLLAQRIEDVLVQHVLAAVDVLDEALHAAGESERLFLAGALVGQDDRNAAVQEGELAQALGEDLVVVLDLAEDLGRGQEMHLRAALLALAGDLERRHCLAQAEFHLVQQPVAADREAQPFRERVHHGDAHAVQPAGNLVRVVVELAPGVKLGHHHLGTGAPFFVVRVQLGRYAPAVVHDADRVVGMDGDRDLVAEARQRLVHGVVDDLEYHVMQAGAVARVADIHPRPLAHGFQPLEDLDAARIVVVGGALQGLFFGLDTHAVELLRDQIRIGITT